MDAIIYDLQTQGRTCSRIRLRPLHLLDAPDMFAYTSCPESCRYLTWSPHTDVSEAEAFIKNVLGRTGLIRDIVWGIEEHISGRLIGVVRIYNISEESASISYILNKDYTGKGYMTEAVREAITVCFSHLGVDIVTAYFLEENAASRMVMERCGMRPSMSSPEVVTHDGKETYLHEYIITMDD